MAGVYRGRIYDPGSPSLQSTTKKSFVDYANLAASRFNRGFGAATSSIVGFPVDVTNAGMQLGINAVNSVGHFFGKKDNLINHHMSSTPFGGSNHLNGLWQGLMDKLDDDANITPSKKGDIIGQIIEEGSDFAGGAVGVFGSAKTAMKIGKIFPSATGGTSFATTTGVSAKSVTADTLKGTFGYAAQDIVIDRGENSIKEKELEDKILAGAQGPTQQRDSGRGLSLDQF